jgi:hypothetical protein
MRANFCRFRLARTGSNCHGQPVTPIADLLIEQHGEPFRMGERGGFGGCFDFTEGLGHAVESELMKQIESWMGEQGLVSLVVVARAADVGMEDRRAVRWLVCGIDRYCGNRFALYR